MNSVQGHIVEVQTSGALSVATVAINPRITWRAIVIETPRTASYLRQGDKITMLFKETEVIIGTGTAHALSVQNRIPATIAHIDRGTLLCKIILKSDAGELTSIISTDAAEQLELKEHLPVTAMVKMNEVMLSEL